MKDYFEMTLFFAPRILSICGIIYLMANNKDGWGWLLFFLIITWGGFYTRHPEVMKTYLEEKTKQMELEAKNDK